MHSIVPGLARASPSLPRGQLDLGRLVRWNGSTVGPDVSWGFRSGIFVLAAVVTGTPSSTAVGGDATA
jgi:hypothetical protein